MPCDLSSAGLVLINRLSDLGNLTSFRIKCMALVDWLEVLFENNAVILLPC